MICYGALGVGGVKMKIHKAAVRRLFTANDQVLDAEAIFEIGRDLSAGRLLKARNSASNSRSGTRINWTASSTTISRHRR